MTWEIIQNILSNPLAIVAVVLLFGASIFVHELGHYLAARWRGLVAERFSIGMGPRIFGWTDRRGTVWQVSWLPLGGYVLLPQLADMSGIEGPSPSRAEALPPASYTDKVIVSAAGAFFNVLFALWLGVIVWGLGQPSYAIYEDTRVGWVIDEMPDAEGHTVPGPAYVAGLQPGDRILAIDGDPVERWMDVPKLITLSDGRTESGAPLIDFLIERDGTEQTIAVEPVLEPEEKLRQVGIAPAQPPVVEATMAHSPAEQAGLQAGDVITHLNGEFVLHPGRLSQLVNAAEGTPLTVTFERAGVAQETTLAAQEVVYNVGGDQTWMVGIQFARPPQIIRHVDPLTQIVDALTLTGRMIGALLNPRTDVGLNHLSGPVGISYTLYQFTQLHLSQLLSIVVLININLAIMNLLPIPVLDGGHIAFATIGKLRGKPLPPNLILSLQGAFMVMLLGLMLYVSVFDVGRVGRQESAEIEARRAAAERVPIVFSPPKEASAPVETDDAPAAPAQP